MKDGAVHIGKAHDMLFAPGFCRPLAVRDTRRVTRDTSERMRTKETFNLSYFPFQVSRFDSKLTCHDSPLACHASRVTCHDLHGLCPDCSASTRNASRTRFTYHE
jgi:hypothetical protein